MNIVKMFLVLGVFTGHFGDTAFAQSGSDENATTTAQTEAPKLSRAERRAQRNAERDAERAAERAAAAAENSAAAASAAASTNSAASDDELICRRESVTGTHRRIRICRTKAQMDEMRAESQRILREGARQ